MIPTNRQQTYQEVVERVAQYPDYYGAMREIFPFLEDMTMPLPALSDECVKIAYSYIFPFLGQPSEWGAYDEHIMEFIQDCWANKQSIISSYNYSALKSDLWVHWAKSILANNQDIWTFQKTLSLLKKHGLQESLIWSKAIEEGHILFSRVSEYSYSSDTRSVKTKRSAAEIKTWIAKELSAVGAWVLEHNKEFLDGKKLYLGNTYLYEAYHDFLILTGQRNVITANFDSFCTIQSGWRTELDNITLLDKLLAHDVAGIEDKILDFQSKTHSSEQLITLQGYLVHYFPEKYKPKELEMAYQYLNLINTATNHYYSFDRCNTNIYTNLKPYYNLYINRLIELIFEKEPYETAYSFWKNYLATMAQPNIYIYSYLVDLLQEKALPMLMDVLARPIVRGYYSSDLHKGIFQFLTTIPHEDFYPELWKLAVHKSKEVR
ncbi:MAG: hypothetical protein RLZZ292_2632, partial [Bacteroidota bacterium]